MSGTDDPFTFNIISDAGDGYWPVAQRQKIGVITLTQNLRDAVTRGQHAFTLYPTFVRENEHEIPTLTEFLFTWLAAEPAVDEACETTEDTHYLPPFREDSKCEMCGCERVYVMYAPHQYVYHDDRGFFTCNERHRHFHRECRRCGYMWSEAVLLH